MNHPRLDGIVQRALTDAKDRRHEYITTEHLLGAVLLEDEVGELLESLSIDINEIIADNTAFLEFELEEIGEGETPGSKYTSTLERVFKRAVTQSMFMGSNEIGALDLLLSILTETRSNAAYFCQKHGLTKDSIVDRVVDTAVSNQTEYAQAPGAPST